jgi:hypothetical protein
MEARQWRMNCVARHPAQAVGRPRSRVWLLPAYIAGGVNSDALPAPIDLHDYIGHFGTCRLPPPRYLV